mgnify:CR=1 FL=1
MNLRWYRDKAYTDCWDLRDGLDLVGYIIRSGRGLGSPLRYHRLGRMPDVDFPDLTVDEVKAAVKAMVRLEG